jgi:hypothetical protein
MAKAKSGKCRFDNLVIQQTFEGIGMENVTSVKFWLSNSIKSIGEMHKEW